MARIAHCELMGLAVIDGQPVAQYRLTVIRTGADSPRNPSPELDRYEFDVAADTAMNMDAALAAAALSNASATGLQASEIIMKGRPRDPFNNPPPGGSSNKVTVFNLASDEGSNFILTNATMAEQWPLNQPSRMIYKCDLADYTQVRFVGHLNTGSNLAATKVRVVYKTGSYTQAVGDYANIGTSEVSHNIQSAAYKDTGWIDLAAGAKANDVYFGITVQGGDGVADPAYGALTIQFR